MACVLGATRNQLGQFIDSALIDDAIDSQV